MMVSVNVFLWAALHIEPLIGTGRTLLLHAEGICGLGVQFDCVLPFLASSAEKAET